MAGFWGSSVRFPKDPDGELFSHIGIFGDADFHEIDDFKPSFSQNRKSPTLQIGRGVFFPAGRGKQRNVCKTRCFATPGERSTKGRFKMAQLLFRKWPFLQKTEMGKPNGLFGAAFGANISSVLELGEMFVSKFKFGSFSFETKTFEFEKRKNGRTKRRQTHTKGPVFFVLCRKCRKAQQKICGHFLRPGRGGGPYSLRGCHLKGGT